MEVEENTILLLLGPFLGNIRRSYNATFSRYLSAGNTTNQNYTGLSSVDMYSAGDDDYCDLQYGIQDQTVQSLITIVYSLTILLAVLGNVVVIVVLGFTTRVKTGLNNFLVNLAIADLLTAVVCMPFTFVYIMKEDWLFGPIGCPLVFFTQQVTISVSVFTLTAVSVDRYFAVVRPLKARLARSNKTTIFVIAGIWVSSGMLGTVQLILARSEEYEWCYGTRHLAVCRENWPGTRLELGYEVFNMAVTYFVPVAIFCYTYSVVGRKLWGRNLPGNADHTRDACHQKAKRKVIKMLMVIVFLFVVSWFPIYLYNVILTLTHDLVGNHPQFFFAFFFCGHWLAMSNSFMNPLVFSFFNDSFRDDLRRLFQRCGPCRRRRRPRSRFSTTSSLATRSSSLFTHNQSCKSIASPAGERRDDDAEQQILGRIGATNGSTWTDCTLQGNNELLIQDYSS